MQIHSIPTGNFKLDGGAMFGVVPKSLWSRSTEADTNNLCSWSMRSLLINTGDRLILIDTGIGDKQNDKFFSHFHLFGEDTLESSIQKLGYSIDDITDVLLTHLHFDHCGGAIVHDKEGNLVPRFKNANYWSCKEHWDWAIKPNPREKASFLSENILPIQQSGQLKFIEQSSSFVQNVFPSIDLFFVNGHTESQIIPHINLENQTVVFMADLIPSAAHIPLPYVPSYDTRPLLSMSEKDAFLSEAIQKNFILFFEHDYKNECATIQSTEKGIRLDSTFHLSELGL